MKQVSLHGKYAQGRMALVDDEDYAEISQYRWLANADGYAIAYITKKPIKRGKRGRMMLMHRFLLAAERDKQVDHRNGNRLDNRRENLRLCIQVQNSQNMRPGARVGSSCFKGVSYDKTRGRWLAMIKGNGKRYNLGRFEQEEDAARAYDTKACELFGEYASLNFPMHPPAERR